MRIYETQKRARGASTYHDDGVLDEGLGADQLVVAGVVDHVEDTRLTGAHCHNKKNTKKGEKWEY